MGEYGVVPVLDVYIVFSNGGTGPVHWNCFGQWTVGLGNLEAFARDLFSTTVAPVKRIIMGWQYHIAQTIW
jgi:hypothetical protein